MGSDNNEKIRQDVKKQNPFILVVIVHVALLIGTALAYGLVKLDSADKYRVKMTEISGDDRHWLFLAVVVFGRMIAYVNFFPAGYKNHMKGNLRSNPFIYTIRGGAKDNEDNIVSFEEEGDIGKYNRANRSIHHMIENYGSFLVGFVLAGNVFPKSVFSLVCIFSLGRIAHQAGYTQGYGKHAIGFLLSTLSIVTLEGLCLFVFLNGYGIVNL